MTRILICLLAVCLLGLVLAGCSATGRVGPNGMYGNVSTTTDGRVNGTNDYYNGYSGRDGQTYNDTNGRTYSGTNDRTYNDGTNGQTYHSTNGQTIPHSISLIDMFCCDLFFPSCQLRKDTGFSLRQPAPHMGHDCFS